jgi:uncharacterized protein YhbP (UPF0306 family)
MNDNNLVERGAFNLLETNIICVIATLMRDGSPYASAAHFATDNEARMLYISLHDRSNTAQNILLDGRVAVTVGDDPAVPATLQMRGHAAILQGVELEVAQATFYARFPHSSRHRDDPHTSFVTFQPTWRRYSDAQTNRDFFVRGFSAPRS